MQVQWKQNAGTNLGERWQNLLRPRCKFTQNCCMSHLGQMVGKVKRQSQTCLHKVRMWERRRRMRQQQPARRKGRSHFSAPVERELLRMTENFFFLNCTLKVYSDILPFPDFILDKGLFHTNEKHFSERSLFFLINQTTQISFTNIYVRIATRSKFTYYICVSN